MLIESRPMCEPTQCMINPPELLMLGPCHWGFGGVQCGTWMDEASLSFPLEGNECPEGQESSTVSTLINMTLDMHTDYHKPRYITDVGQKSCKENMCADWTHVGTDQVMCQGHAEGMKLV